MWTAVSYSQFINILRIQAKNGTGKDEIFTDHVSTA